MSKDALADKTNDFGEQDAGGDGKCGGATVGLLRLGEVGQVGWYLVRGWRGVGHACSL